MSDLIVKILKITGLIVIVGTIVGYMASTFIPALSGFAGVINTGVGYLSRYLYCARATINWLCGTAIVNVMLITSLTLPFVKLGLRWMWRFQNLDQN